MIDKIKFALRYVQVFLTIIVLGYVYILLFCFNSTVLICTGRDKYYRTFHKKIEDHIYLWYEKYDI